MLYLIGFGIPGLGLFGRIDPSVLGTIAVVMGYSAYVSEVLRAGFNDVHPSQRASARSLGLTSGQTTRLIVIPQALRKVAPALMNDFISMQKDVGLISVLGAVDAVRAAQIDVASTYNFTPYVVASLLFILMSVPFILLNDWYTERLRSSELSGRKRYERNDHITTEASDSPVSNKTVLRLDDVRKSFGNTRCCVAFPLTFTNMRWMLCWGLPA